MSDSEIRAEELALARKIQPTRDLLFVRMDRNAKKVGSIILPGNSREKLDIIVSEVMARGPDVKAKKWDLAPGDYVMHVRVVAVKYDGILGRVGRDVSSEFAFLHEKDVLAVCDPSAVIQGAAQYDEGKTGVWRQ